MHRSLSGWTVKTTRDRLRRGGRCYTSASGPALLKVALATVAEAAILQFLHRTALPFSRSTQTLRGLCLSGLAARFLDSFGVPPAAGDAAGGSVVDRAATAFTGWSRAARENDVRESLLATMAMALATSGTSHSALGIGNPTPAAAMIGRDEAIQLERTVKRRAAGVLACIAPLFPTTANDLVQRQPTDHGDVN